MITLLLSLEHCPLAASFQNEICQNLLSYITLEGKLPTHVAKT